jgi:hypothetical protein
MMLTSRIKEVEADSDSYFEKLDQHDLRLLDGSCRLVRQLHKAGDETSALLRKIDQFNGPGGLIVWIDLDCPMNPSLKERARNQIRQLGEYLAQCHGFNGVQNVSVGTGTSTQSKSYKRPRERTDIVRWDWSEPQTATYASGAVEQRDSGMELRRLQTDVPKEVRERLGESALLADEFHQDTEHWLGILHSDEPDPDEEDESDSSGSPASKGEIETGLPSYAKYFTAGRHKAMKFAFTNQRTATRWALPTMAEYAELLSAVERRYRWACRTAEDLEQSASVQGEAKMVRDLCLTLSVVTALGRSFDAVRELYVLDNETQVLAQEIKDEREIEIAFLREENRWLVRTTKVPYAPQSKVEPQLWYQRVVDRIFLPDVIGVGQLVCLKADHAGKQPLAVRQRETLWKRFEKHFTQWRGGRARLGWTLDTLSELLGDWLEVHEAPTVTGLLVPRLAQHVSTQLFYTVLEASRLEQAYTEAWQQLEVLLHKEGVRFGYDDECSLFCFHPQMSQRPHEANAGAYIGAERVAPRDYFRQLVRSLKNTLKGDWQRMDLIAKHNAYTAYTWLYLALATASRGVHHPFEHLDVAVEVGSINLHDKDYEGGGQARVAFLPQPLIRHLEGYLCWCRRLLQVMARVTPASKNWRSGFNRMEVESGRRTLQPAAGEDDYPVYGSLFFLTSEWYPEPATPKKVRERLGTRHPLPANAQRHMLRTYLIEEKCPEDIIDAFLGHWDRGREPWASYGVVDPWGYRQKLLQYLEPLLELLGFEPVEPAHE